MTKETKKVEQKVEDTAKIKMSELIAQRDELDKKSQEMLSESQKIEYKISFGTKKVFTECMKYLEKNSPWNAYTAAGLIMLYNNMNEQKEVIKKMEGDGKTWDGIVKLRTANITILWKMLTQMTGTGFYAAKDFVGVMAKIGDDVTKAIQQVDKRNAEVREIHTQLEKIMSRIENPDENVEIDVDLCNINKTSMEQLKDEVAPAAE